MSDVEAPGPARASRAARAGTVSRVRPEVALISDRVVGVELLARRAPGRAALHAAAPHGPEARAVRRQQLQWLLAQACAWARTWQHQRGAPVTVSVPIIGDLLQESELLALACDELRRTGLPHGTLDLLLGRTGGWLRGSPAVRDAAARLRTAGASLTLVGVGAGALPLRQLARLGPDRLKIHGSLVRDVTADPERMAVARAVIAVALTLRITTVASKVSSDADVQFFRWEGCEFGQGDALAPACAPAEVAGLWWRAASEQP